MSYKKCYPCPGTTVTYVSGLYISTGQTVSFGRWEPDYDLRTHSHQQSLVASSYDHANVLLLLFADI